MQKKEFKYIYGPVPSWRLGSSLGIDPISFKDKICTFDCIYCQIGKTRNFSSERKIYVYANEIIDEISSLPPVEIDYMTFSGACEPTLAENLGQVINDVKTLRKNKIAVITNSSLLYRQDVRQDLLQADFVIAKLDACSNEVFEKINRPMKEITFNTVLEGIRQFRTVYSGKLALQIMFLEENRKYAGEISKIAQELGPDEIQVNTPLRQCGVKPLPKEEIARIKGYFKNMNVISVYDSEKKEVVPISSKDTLKRRGKII